MEILTTILISILATAVVSIIAFLIKPIKNKIYRWLGRDLGARNYTNRNGNKIYIFPKKQNTRVSVSVLAKIEKDGKFLSKSKKPTLNRQDSMFKPLGGTIKITKKMEKILKNRNGFRFDSETRYSAKAEDFRLFMDLNNNKIIHKAISSENVEYFQKELWREIREELGNVSFEEVDSIFEFKEKQPMSIQVHYTEPDFSFLRCHDYVHHIFFELKIKDEIKLQKIVSKNKKLRWITLKGSENKAITVKLLDRKNKFNKFPD